MKTVLLLLVFAFVLLPMAYPYSDYPQNFITKYTIYDSPEPMPDKPITQEAPKFLQKRAKCNELDQIGVRSHENNYRVVCARNKLYSGHSSEGNLNSEAYCRNSYS